MKSNIDKAYQSLLKRRRLFFVYALATPLLLGSVSKFVGENYIFIGVFFYICTGIAWMLYLYFSACPSCGGLFYGGKTTEKGIGVHKFFMNKQCNQCGFTSEG